MIGDWDVDYELLDFQKMIDVDASDSGYTSGNIKTYGNHQEALIYLNKNCSNRFRKTIKHTLIHEFIHLLMYDLDSYINAKFPNTYKDDYFNELEEQFVNRVTSSIWNIMNNRYVDD
jgi:Zn-dependent peptidase ImmA (M78 family)